MGVAGIALWVGCGLTALPQADDARRGGSRPAAVWLGQDGRDFASASYVAEPSGVQDIHIALRGLAAGRRVASVQVLDDRGAPWDSDPNARNWRAVVKQAEGSTTADVYVEPGRLYSPAVWTLEARLDDGSTLTMRFKTKSADPALRAASAKLAARWVGQERRDRVGASPAVGADGLQDARIELDRLAKGVAPRSLVIKATLPATRRVAGSKSTTAADSKRAALVWRFGLNRELAANAELVVDPKDASHGDVYFQPTVNLKGATLALELTYENGTTDTASVVAGATDGAARMPSPSLPKRVEPRLKGRFLGQDLREGDTALAHIALTGLAGTRVPAAAVLSDAVGGVWAYRGSDRVRVEAEPGELPMTYAAGTDRTSAGLYFTPIRDEAGSRLTLRLVYADGSIAVADIDGGGCDPLRRAPLPSATNVVARPGDDLRMLVARGGTIRLATGVHRLDAPLVLEQPTALVGEPGAELRFEQRAGDAPWTAAIKIHAGGTSLEGFAIRFAGPIRWNRTVSYGPAVIGTTDDLDQPEYRHAKVGLRIERLDVDAPPALKPTEWEEAPRLARLTDTHGGVVAKNILRGGMIEFFGGPWRIEDNEYRGTPAGTFSHAVLVGHAAFDATVKGNRARPASGSGKTWRFLVLTNQGTNILVKSNSIEGLGPRDDDVIPSMNAPEIILTESYRTKYEGIPAAISSDGRVVRVVNPWREAIRAGDVVAVVEGKAAGIWRRVAQALGPETFLLDAPLPADARAVTIVTGYVGCRIEDNVIDSRGSRSASNLVLAGNHFGTVVARNTFRGGGESVRLQACATEQPAIWGWSRAPFFGGAVESNVFEDAAVGGLIGVEDTKFSKSTRGRLYMKINLRDNTFGWTKAYRPVEGRAWVAYEATTPHASALVIDESGTRFEGAPAGVAPRTVNRLARPHDVESAPRSR